MNLFKHILFTALIFSALYTNAQLKMYNYGTPDFYEVGSEIIILPDSSKIISAPQYNSQAAADLNTRQSILFKVDKNENFVWGRKFTSPLLNTLFYKLANDGNVFIYGMQNYQGSNYGTGQAFVGKINVLTGALMWVNGIQSNTVTPFSEILSLKELPSGNIIVAGRVNRDNTLICSLDSYVAKLNASGAVLSSKVYDFGTNGAGCPTDYLFSYVDYTADTLLFAGSKRGPVANAKDNRNNGFFVLMDTNLNLGSCYEIDFRFTESATESEDGRFFPKAIINNKLIVKMEINGPVFNRTRTRAGYAKINLSTFTIEKSRVIKSGSAVSSFTDMVVLGEDDYFFTQSSTPAFYGYSTDFGTVGGSANSFISRIKNDSIYYTKFYNDIGYKGFNALQMVNDKLYGIGFTHQGNNQIESTNQDIFIAEIDTNFSSFEICSFSDSAETFLDTLTGNYIMTYTPVLRAEVMSNFVVSVTNSPLYFSPFPAGDSLTILNECQCIYRDTVTASCLPYITSNGDTITSPGIYTIDSLIYPASCDTIYYANLTGADVINPVANCQNANIYVNGAGNITIDSSIVNNGSTDNCAITSMALSQSSFNCSNLGGNSVTLTVYDAAGNFSTCISTITVLDTIVPTALCKNDTVYLNGSGNASIVASQIDNGSTDNCGIASLSVLPNAFTCSDTGANSITLTVTDVNGNSATCNSTVTVMDTISSIAGCKDTSIYLNGAGIFTIDSSYVITSNGGGCASVTSVLLDQTTFNCLSVGVNVVNITINGTISCTSTVAVLDSIKPSAVCQSVNVYLDATGNAIIDSSFIDAGSFDNCGVISMVLSKSNFNCSDIGANSVTMIVTDVNGNVDSCIGIVTIIDSTSPAVLCQNITVYLDASGNVSVNSSAVNNGSTDNCGISSLSLSTSMFNCSTIGANNVWLIAADSNGNIDSCLSIITVLDTLKPLVICQPITAYLDGSGSVIINSSQIDNGSSDNCGILSMVVYPNSFTCSDIGLNNITLVVSDINGNIDSCSTTVIVSDSLPPTALTNNLVAYLDTAGNVTVSANQIDNGSIDNCGVDTMYLTPSIFNCNDVGINPTMFTVIDIYGNTTNTMVSIDVRDSIFPWFVSCPIIMFDTIEGICEYVVPNFMDSLSFYDNCDTSIATIIQSPIPGTVLFLNSDVPSPLFTINVTVTDPNNNSATCVHQLELGCYPEIQIPQFITPNQDNENDVWYISGLEAFPQNELRIFNRLGNIVFHTLDYKNDWAGKANKGFIFNRDDQILPAGTYFYILEVMLNNESKFYKGYIYIRE